MRLSAVVSREELVGLVEAFTPLRIMIDERRGRSVTLGRPDKVELAPGQGLRLRGSARIAWDVAGVGIPVTIQAWQVLLVPRILARGRSRVLAFEPVMEELDLKLVPGFLDDKIAEAIRSGVTSNRERLAWDFARAFSKRVSLPAKVGPARAVEIAVVDGGITVTAEELRVDLRIEARVEKRAAAGRSADGVAVAVASERRPAMLASAR